MGALEPFILAKARISCIFYIYLKQVSNSLLIFKKIISYINKNDFSEIKSLKKVANSGKRLEVRGADNAAIVIFQFSEYIPHNFFPASPVVVLRGNEAKVMLEFIKS